MICCLILIVISSYDCWWWDGDDDDDDDLFSHRPVDVHNVFNAIQVKLLMKEEDFDDNPVPDYDSVFRENEVSGWC